MSTPSKKPPASSESGDSDSNNSGNNKNPRLFTAADLEDSTAEETNLLENIEGRRGHTRTESGDDFRTAVSGERPLLGGNVSFDTMYKVYGNPSQDAAEKKASDDEVQAKQKPRLQAVVRKILLNRRAAQTLTNAAMERKHKRSTSTAQVFLQSIQEDTTTTAAAATAVGGGTINAAATRPATVQEVSQDTDFFAGVAEVSVDVGASTFAVEDSSADTLFAGAMQVEALFDDDTASVGSESTMMTPSGSQENLPLLATHPLLGGDGGPQGYGSVQEIRRSRRRRRRFWRKFYRYSWSCCHPVNNIKRVVRVFQAAYFLWLSMPLFVGAWILYYYFGNIEIDFMPGSATLSWWFNFCGRQLLTLELSRASQWLIVDCCALGSRLAVSLFGPYVTLLAIQAKGWPFILAAWGTWDLFLLHGNNTFQTHWFFWTGLEIYSKANSGSYILKSDMYLRALLCMLLAGIMTSLKRTYVAVYVGRRTFAEFKPRLEKILKDSVLLSEVAELAEEADNLQTMEHSTKPSLKKGIGAGTSVKWFADDLNNSNSDDESNDGGSEGGDSSNVQSPVFSTESRSNSSRTPELSRSSSGSFKVKDLLDRWEEPENKLDKSSDASAIHDILKFRRALSYMDESHPFGESFGPATTRDECIASAHSVYFRLLKLTPDASVLSNDVLSMLAQDEDGISIRPKQLALKRLFRPDRYNNLPLLAFLQSCDSLYKKLRYFRASVGNASVIDHILEWQFDCLFAFLLFLVILSIMNFNPWPLLVSLSTLLVSFSFAMGSSASKYIEGLLLVSVRRPYDLGDRIVLSSPDGLVNPGVGCSWFVEDISLYSTTLRYGQTNEVATVSNGTIAGSRIVNCNRSPNAVVVFDLMLHICLLQDENAATFVAAIEKYIAQHPRIWDCMVLFRFDRFDADMEQVYCRVGVRHRNSWQDAARILRDNGELQKFIYQLGETMDVNFDSPPARRLVYSGGTLLKSGQVSEDGPNFKSKLLQPKNIRTNVRNMEPNNGSFRWAPQDKPDVEASPQEVADDAFLANLREQTAS